MTETQNPNVHHRKNHARRCLGILICGAPFALFIASAICGMTHESPSGRAATVLIALACLTGALNFYLSFIRPSLYRLAHKSMEGYRFVSGLPMVGTALAVAAGIAGFGSVAIGVLGCMVLILDTGGAPWFAYSTWRDQSFWDR